MSSRTRVLFVCIHNAGRSQIAAALAQHLHGDVLDARSAGLSPDAQVSEVAADVLMGRGIDITGKTPRLLLDGDLESADVVITLVQDIEIEVPAGVREETWFLPDPASWTPHHLEPLVDHISARIDDLVQRLAHESASS